MAKVFKAGTNDAVVSTKAGKLRGFYFDGVYCFHGIQYATAKRFEQTNSTRAAISPMAPSTMTAITMKFIRIGYFC